jgi:hypothetical protein
MEVKTYLLWCCKRFVHNNDRGKKIIRTVQGIISVHNAHSAQLWKSPFEVKLIITTEKNQLHTLLPPPEISYSYSILCTDIWITKFGFAEVWLCLLCASFIFSPDQRYCPLYGLHSANSRFEPPPTARLFCSRFQSPSWLIGETGHHILF